MSEGSRQEMMEATYSALSRHGYADLSIQKIADEFDKGKSLIYYHYDDKEDLMLSFLDYMLQELEAEHQRIMGMPEEEQLDRMLDVTLGLEDEERWQFQKSLLELKAQAAHRPKFAEKFDEMDNVAHEKFKAILNNRGIEDPKAAKILLTAVDGAIGRKVSTRDREGLKDLKKEIKKVIKSFMKD